MVVLATCAPLTMEVLRIDWLFGLVGSLSNEGNLTTEFDLFYLLSYVFSEDWCLGCFTWSRFFTDSV